MKFRNEVNYVKARKRILTGIFILSTLFALLRITNVLGVYKIAGSAMYPQHKDGDIMVFTRFKKPKRHSVVLHKSALYSSRNKYNLDTTAVNNHSRIIGLENETVEIKNGVVYVNDMIHSQSFTPVFMVKITKSDFDQLKTTERDIFLKDQVIGRYVFLFVTQENLEYLSRDNRYEIVNKEPNRDFYNLSEETRIGWSQNNYGPVIVPKNHYFILADNRNNGIDSRIIGSIHENEIIGVKI
jgi:signal peptidase I